MASTPRTRAPERPPPPLEPPPPDPSPSPPGAEYHTPTPSLGEASPREASPEGTVLTDEGRAPPKSPQLSPVRLPSPHRLPPPGSPAGSSNGHDAAPSPVAHAHARPQLRLATGLVRTPSQGSLAKSPSPSPSPTPPSQGSLAKSPSPSPSPTPPSQGSLAKLPSPSPTPPSPLTPDAAPAPAPTPAVNSKSGQNTPKRAEAWKPPPPSPVPAPIVVQFDPAEEIVTSPLRIGDGKPRADQQRRTPAAAENGGSAVPPDVAAVAAVGERRPLSAALRMATAVLSLAAFSVMASARTSGWAGDYYGRYEQYRYAVAVNVIVCVYSIAQSFGEIRRLISPRFIFRSMSSYYFSLFLDQVLAYLLMSASSAAASRNDLWVSRFGTDPFNKKISSAVWLSSIAFLTLAANALISTANLFSMV